MQSEKKRIVECRLESPATSVNDCETQFWTADYPIMCYLQNYPAELPPDE